MAYPLVVGLGNPGAKYLFTRHNVGFMVLDAWAAEDSLRFRAAAWADSEFAPGPDEARLIKPQTFVNESGRAVKRWLEKLELGPEALLVVVDDVALPLGQIRLRPEGSSGGHNGLKSIAAHLGTEKFARVRCGVGAVPPGWALERWVLARFAREEEAPLGEMIGRARSAIEDCQRVDIALAMNRWNGTMPLPPADSTPSI